MEREKVELGAYCVRSELFAGLIYVSLRIVTTVPCMGLLLLESEAILSKNIVKRHKIRRTNI